MSTHYHRYDPFPAPDSPEWGPMNHRRAELIRRTSLTQDEAAELRYLQENALNAVDKAFPRDTAMLDALDSLVQRLEGKVQ